MTSKFSEALTREGDWVVIKPDDVILDLNEIKKKYPSVMFHLAKDAPELATILKESFDCTLANFFSHTIKNSIWTRRV